MNELVSVKIGREDDRVVMNLDALEMDLIVKEKLIEAKN